MKQKIVWVTVLAFFTLVSGVIANDRLSRSRDEKINESSVIRDRGHDKEISGVQQSLAGVQVELKYLSKITEKNGNMQEKILDVLSKLNKDG